jgi:CBS domain containing-hemolysin-like protein
LDPDPASSIIQHAPAAALLGTLLFLTSTAAYVALARGAHRALLGPQRTRLLVGSVAALVLASAAAAALLALLPARPYVLALIVLGLLSVVLAGLPPWVGAHLSPSSALAQLLTGSRAPARPGTPAVAAWIADEAPTLDDQQADMLFALATFGETTAREIMTSRVDMTALPATASLDEVLTTIRETGYSRFPVYVEHLDNILGLVHAKDLLAAAATPGRPFRLAQHLRPTLFVPESKPLDALLRRLRARRVHLAVVVDEYGGTAGLVTMEDLLEEIVGDMQDERDEDEALLLRRSSEAFEVDARHNLEDLIGEIGVPLDTDEFAFDTLGGLIYDCVGAVPEPGTTCDYGPLRMTVETVHNHRIGRVLVEIVEPQGDGEA